MSGKRSQRASFVEDGVPSRSTSLLMRFPVEDYPYPFALRQAQGERTKLTQVRTPVRAELVEA